MSAALAVTAVVAASAMVTPAQASAGNRHVLVHHDARHDVRLVHGAGNSQRAPGYADGDITSIRARYAAHNLRVHVFFAQLDKPKKGDSDSSGLYELDVTASGKHFAVLEFTNSKVAHGNAQFFSDDPDATCHVGHTINYAQAHLTFTVPAHCLGSAPWVRVGFNSELFMHDGSSYDLALADGDHGVHDGAAFSGRLYRE